MGNGIITAHALMSLEARGILFATPGMEVIFLILSFSVVKGHNFVSTIIFFFTHYLFIYLQTYDGMIVGEHSRDTDLDVKKMRLTFYILSLANLSIRH